MPAPESRAAQCEALGRVPDETQCELLAAGLYRILQPARYGGHEHEPTVHYRVVMEPARGCPSAAWVFSIGEDPITQLAIAEVHWQIDGGRLRPSRLKPLLQESCSDVGA